MAEPITPNNATPPPRRSLLRRRAASFGHAFRGIGAALRSEVHLRFHALATVVVLGMGLYFGISALEWALVALAVGTVWSAELVNTAVEAIVDMVSPEYHPLAGKAKDVAAGAVLLAAIAALVIGGLVFGSYVLAAVGR